MGRAEPIAAMSYADYLAHEADGPTKHEYLDGHVYAMAGGTPEHGALAAAVIGELRAALRGRPCRVYSSDVRVHVRATGLTTYPDVTVVCGRLETDAVDADAITNPTLIVEVLSPTTEGYDRGARASHYRQIATLREYVLVGQNEQRVEVQRLVDGVWTITDARPGDVVNLTSVGVALDVSVVYANPLSVEPAG